VGGILVGEIGQESEIDNFPGGYVAGAGYQGDEDADGESAAEGEAAAGNIFAIRADAEEDQERREDDAGVAEDFAFVPADPVDEWDGDEHHDGGYGAGDEAESEDGFFHGR